MMASDLHIFGTGGHARDVAELAAAAGYIPILVARDRSEADAAGGADRVVFESDHLFRPSLTAAIGIGDNASRHRTARKLAGRAHFPTIVHPDTTLGRGLRESLERVEGTMIFAGVRTTGNVQIGSFCTINLNVSISHDGVLEDFVNLSPGAVLAGNVLVQRGAWIGAGAIVNQGHEGCPRVIGAGSMVGSGAVVLSDCEPGATYIGVPARAIT